MSKISKFIKLDRDVLLEYIYNDGNLISEPYNILINSRDKINSYIAYDTTITGNNIDNQLFIIDYIDNKWDKVDVDKYSFLQVKNYSDALPIRHDTLRFHLPINWTFGEYLGFHIRVYAFNLLNNKEYNLSNFYFDMSDVNQQELLKFSTPALLFQEKMWGKYIELQVPALSEISSQLINNRPAPNSINFNLTDGNGLNMTSPIFVEFNFINDITSQRQYLLHSPVVATLPQTPEFEKLGLKIEASDKGDFYEIYGTYNNTIGEFNKFIDDSYVNGNRYYVEYHITMFEQNIRGKTMTVSVQDNFNDVIEYRPIIKYSTTTAIIDVEMRLIDSVDNSYILRTASYGMLQDEVSKYSLNMMKINLDNAYKPKIYNIKSNINPELVGVSNSFGIIPVNNSVKSPKISRVNPEIMTEQNIPTEKVNVYYPVFIEKYNIMAKSESSILNEKKFEGFGRIKILLYPFDNIIGFTIAEGDVNSPSYLDLSSFTELRFVIKNDDNTLSFDPYDESDQLDLVNGFIVFKLGESRFKEIKKIHKSGINAFYITGKNQSTTSLIYTGLFDIYDTNNNINELNELITEEIVEEKPALKVTTRQVSAVESIRATTSDKMNSLISKLKK